MSVEEWQDFFSQDYLSFSESILTPERTEYEVNQILTLMPLEKRSSILDLCCGQGRLAVPLAQKEYHMTGYDGSLDLLKAAQERAQKAKITLDLIHGDMRELPYTEKFDLVLNFGTAFGYIKDEMADQNILHLIQRSLKRDGYFLMDTENRELKLKGTMGTQTYDMNGISICSEREYDCATGRWRETLSWFDGTVKKTSVLDLRLYSAPELIRMIRNAGMDVIGVFGGMDFSELCLSSLRTVIWARKP